MSHVPHELAADFPELAQAIHERKVSDPHFARLLDEYHEINRQVHRAETEVEPISEMAEVGLRKERARLKDILYKTLTESA